MDEALGLGQGVQSPSAVTGFCGPSRLAFPGRSGSGLLLLGELGLCLRPPEVRLFSISPPCAVCVLSLVQLCATPTHWSPPGSSVHGILQARVLEWVAISSSRASSLARDQTWVSCISCIGRQILSHCATWNDVVIQQALIKHLLYTTTLS